MPDSTVGLYGVPRSEALSTTILREQGPMTLRDVTAATAKRLRWSLLYDDVDSVLRGEEEAGRVVHEEADDYRDWIWRAV